MTRSKAWAKQEHWQPPSRRESCGWATAGQGAQPLESCDTSLYATTTPFPKAAFSHVHEGTDWSVPARSWRSSGKMLGCRSRGGASRWHRPTWYHTGQVLGKSPGTTTSLLALQYPDTEQGEGFTACCPRKGWCTEKWLFAMRKGYSRRMGMWGIK